MASDYTEDKSKRKSMRKGGRKLPVGEKVEVRSFEEGSKGSWHCGTVISCRKATRVVKYDHLLSDEDTSKKFVDVVGVSDYVDGIVNSDTSLSLSDYRGWIRPVPPQFTFDTWLLHYGQCVDMFYMDAWWEGVIFDHQDGSSVRSIFFPDIGDEMEAHKDDLRITHDWDERGQKWKPRGNWLFLELIEEIEKDWPLLVSVKQIWYDVRVKKGFNNLKEWTSSLADIWRKLLLEVIVDNLRLTVKEFFDKLKELSGEDFQLLELDEPTLDAILNNEAFFDDSLPIVTVTTRLTQTQLVHGDIKEVVNQPFDDINMDKSVAALRLDTNADTNAPVCSSHELTHEDPICMVASCPAKFCKGDSSTDHEESLDNEHVWTPNPDFVHKAEYCPDSIEQYCTLVRESKGEFKGKSNRGSEVKLSEVRLSVWKHLLFIGWTIEFRRSKSLNRMRRSRYTEPGSSGRCFHSLNKACKYLLGSGFVSNILSLCTDLKPKAMVPDNWDRAKLPEVELCENAIIEYYNVSKRGHPPSEQLSINALKRLRFLGWKIEFIQYERCWRYTHPDGSDKCFSSLFDVCEYLTKSACAIVALPPQDEHNSALRAITNLFPRSRLSQGCSDEFIKSYNSDELVEHSPPDDEFIKSYNSDELVEHSPPDDIIHEPLYCHQAVMNYYSRGLKEQGEKLKDMQVKAKKHLSAVGWKLYYYYRNNSRAFKELRYSSPSGKLYYSLQSACKGYLDELISMGKQAEVELIGEGQFSPLAIKEFHGKQGEEEVIYSTSCVQHHVFEFSNPLRKEGNPKEIQVTNLRDNLHGTSGRVLRSSKRIREAPSSSNSSPRTILSWLIDNDMVLPRAKVHCRRKKDNQKIAEGRVTRDGIKCNCCQGVFTLSKFETHAKSAYHQPTANIYLEDGRSLLDCQMQLRRDVNTSGSTTRPYEVKRKIQKENDHICSMCHLGGDLILCDRCPSSFHTSCLGLKEVPNGDWFCPPCCCKICGQSETNMDLDVFISCAQCKFRYHIDCLRKKGLVLEGCPNGYWFCTTRCEQISSGLEKILGKPIEIGIDNITWTLLKYTKPDNCNADSSVVVDSTEKYSKLNIALGVMHECFEPISEHQTTDLVEDVIFNRWSELNRLNFRGFYTVLLEKNDELICAASVRIYGEKVAEIPLVATRFAYRRHGMCRILMNQLEKVLVELGVQRLVLPAIPSVLNTWISSFGFTRMSKSQRLKFLDYSFLSFERTIMCQKLLLKTPCRDSLPPRIRKRHSGVTNGSDNINSTDLRGNKSRSRNDKDSLALAVRQPTDSEYIVGQPEINPERSVEGSDSTKEDEGSGPIICYKRRRISKSGEA